MSRLENLVAELRAGCTDTEIVAGLGNGDIDAPEWLAMSEGINSVDIWDAENGGSCQMGFITISCHD